LIKRRGTFARWDEALLVAKLSDLKDGTSLEDRQSQHSGINVHMLPPQLHAFIESAAGEQQAHSRTGSRLLEHSQR
jgi:hypothetical protein